MSTARKQIAPERRLELSLLAVARAVEMLEQRRYVTPEAWQALENQVPRLAERLVDLLEYRERSR